MSTDVVIVGVGMTPFGRFGAQETVASLVRRAVEEAKHDAAIEQEQIDAAVFGNMGQSFLEGQHAIPGQIALRSMGITGIPVMNVENACATGATALHLAINQVRSGSAAVALAIGVERMTASPLERSMALFDGAHNVHDASDLDAVLTREVPDSGGVTGARSVFMDIYAAWARAHMRLFGTTQRQLAKIAAKNHEHAVTNPRAHYRKSMGAREILEGRPLAYPLTVPMCAPITDGASAAIVCRADHAAKLTSSPAVRVRASVIGTGVERAPDDLEQHVSRRAAMRAYEEAGVAPHDIDVAEVHDATAFGELIQTELLGLCDLGQGGHLAARGATRIGGRIPVNPSGGLESKGHPLSATGLGQVFELVEQLRGRAGVRQVEGARMAIAENGGGFLEGEEAVAAITILERMDQR